MESHQPTNLNHNKKIKKLIPLLFFVVVGGSFLLLNKFFSIDSIDCHNQNSVCSSETEGKLQRLKGKSLFFTDLEKKLAEFEITAIQKKLPNHLSISLKENTQNYYTLNNQDVVQTDYENQNEQVSSLANELINELQAADIKPEKTEFISQVFIIYFTSRNEKYRALIDAHDAKTGVYRLKTVLEHVDIKGQVDVAVKEIDTRFKMPVLKTQFTSI